MFRALSLLTKRFSTGEMVGAKRRLAPALRPRVELLDEPLERQVQRAVRQEVLGNREFLELADPCAVNPGGGGSLCGVPWNYTLSLSGAFRGRRIVFN